MFDFAKRIWREVRRLFDYTTLKTALGRELTLSQSMVEALESWGGMMDGKAPWCVDPVAALRIEYGICREFADAVLVEMESDEVKGGDIVIATSAIRQEGTSREYLPIEFPAAASFDIVLALKQAAEKLGYPHHVGVVQSKDSFYGEIRPALMPIADELTAKWKAWKAAGALTSEMESAALMIVAQVLHVRCGAVLNVLWNADNDDAPAIPPDAAERGVRAAVEAIRILIREDHAKA